MNTHLNANISSLGPIVLLFIAVKGLIFKVLVYLLTEEPYSKLLERNVVYIPILTLSHATSHDFKRLQRTHGSLQAEKVRVNVLLKAYISAKTATSVLALI